MSTSHTQLTEASDEEILDFTPKPQTSRLRGFGLAMAVVGLVCMVGANWPRTNHVAAHQRFHQMRDMIVQAVEDHVASPADSSLITTLELEFGQDGGEDPSAMNISAKIAEDDMPPGQFVVEVIFNAEETKGEDLKQAFVSIQDSFLSTMRSDEADHFKNMVNITASDDEVKITVTDVTGDLVRKDDMDKMDDDSTPHPEIAASITFGRDLDSLYSHLDSNIAEVWNGIHLKCDMKFKGLILKVIEGMLPFHPEVGGEDALSWGLGLHSLAGKVEIRYKKEDELGDALDTLPTMEDAFALLKHIAKPLAEPLKGLKGSINGVKSIEIRGLPQSLKIRWDFDHFKPAKLMNRMIDDIQAAAAVEDDAAAVAAE